MGHLFVGIDLSLRSPGLALYSPSTKRLWTYFYATREKDIGRKFQTSCQWKGGTFFSTEAFPIQTTNLSLLDKYSQITADILQTIQYHVNAEKSAKIRMEGYAFGAKSSSVSKLHEIGGVLKYRLHLSGFTIDELPPTSLKKHFTGCGNASKKMMYEKFVELGFPALLAEFDMSSEKEIVPNPVQDIVDACALISSLLNTELVATKKRKR